METIKQILMRRDNMTKEEAEELILEVQVALKRYLEDGEIELAENICVEFFGLEPDYLDELI